jgi:hypothetical protein
MRSLRWLGIFLIGFLLLGCGRGVTYPLNLRYQPLKEFPGFQQKIGSTLAVAPFKDERQETLYIGIHTPLEGASNHFKSDPFPLEKAIGDSLSEVFSRYGIKTVPIPDWDGKPDSLKNLETDSVLMIDIKKFWSEGKGSLFGTRIKTSIQLAIHLGVKKEKTAFTRTVGVEKEITVARSTPEKVEEMINQMLNDIFDTYFSNPY